MAQVAQGGIDLRRILHLVRARWASGPQGGSPVAALLSQAVVSSFLCALVRDALPPFAYGLFAFSLTGCLVAIPLLGEFGWLLRRDAAAEWVGSLPVRPRELDIARTLHLCFLLWLLALGSLLPAAVVAPPGMSLGAQLALPLLGLGMTTFVAALVLAVQALLGERAETALLGFQTVLVVGVVVGFLAGLQSIPELSRIEPLGSPGSELLALFPPTWFAAPLEDRVHDLGGLGDAWGWWLPIVVGVASFVALVALPRPAAGGSVRAGSMSLLLWPLRRLTHRLWLRGDERGAFDLVFDAVPLEREVQMRTVPMVGIPLAFLLVSSLGGGEADARRADMLALICFSAGIYLPILLTHVPASASPGAGWVHLCAPVSEGAMASGAIKALFVRFLVPLYVALSAVAWVEAGPGSVLTLTLPGLGISLLVLRRLYGICVADAPLTVAPEDIRFDLNWMGVLGGVAIVLPILALLANRLLTPWMALPVLVGLVGLELLADRGLRRRLG